MTEKRKRKIILTKLSKMFAELDKIESYMDFTIGYKANEIRYHLIAISERCIHDNAKTEE